MNMATALGTFMVNGGILIVVLLILAMKIK